MFVLQTDHLEADDLPASFGPFTLHAVLGEGGMGRVFRASSQSGLGVRKEVALKVVRGSVAAAQDDALERVRAEARLGASLRHPNLVQLHDAGEVDGQPWLAMELIDGGTLADRLRDGPLPPGEALRILDGVAAGLAWMHRFEGGVVHRDLKPGNVLLHHGLPKIADYGLSITSRSGWTRAVGGTPAYMSPEQSRGEALDGRSDLFSLGALAYELLTGARYLPGRSVVELVMNLVRVEDYLPRLARLNAAAPGLGNAVARCLRADRTDRWSDVDAFRAALSSLSPRRAALTLTATPVAAPPPDTVATPVTDTAWFARLGRDEERARLRRAGGDDRLARLVEAVPQLEHALAQASGDEAVHIALALAAPLLHLGRHGDLRRILDLPTDDPALARRLRCLSLTARRAAGEEVDEELTELFFSSGADLVVAADAAVELCHRLLRVDRPKARLWAERSLAAFGRIGEPARAAKALSEVAILDRMDGLVVRAAERFSEAQTTLDVHGTRRDRLNVMVNLWPVLADLGRRHDAHDLAARAMALAEQVDDPTVCLHAVTNQASMLAQSGYLGRAVAAADAGLNRWGSADRQLATWLRGAAASWRGLLGEAGADGDVQAAVERFRTHGEHRLASFLELAWLALRRRATGERDLADLDRIAALFEQDRRGRAEVAVERAWRTGDPADIEAALQQARAQSVHLSCEALGAAAALPGPSAADHAATGLRLALRTEHLLDAARFHRRLARLGVDPERHDPRADALLADLGVPVGSPAA